MSPDFAFMVIGLGMTGAGSVPGTMVDRMVVSGPVGGASILARATLGSPICASSGVAGMGIGSGGAANAAVLVSAMTMIDL